MVKHQDLQIKTLEIYGPGSETQLQMGENLNYLL